MSLEKLIENGYAKAHDFNCAEAIVRGANQTYGLGLSEEALKLSAGFGGGMGVEKDCGVVAGMVMVLSHQYVCERGHNSPEMQVKIQEAIAAFESIYGDTNCQFLKAKYRSETKGCLALIQSGARILDEMLMHNPKEAGL